MPARKRLLVRTGVAVLAVLAAGAIRSLTQQGESPDTGLPPPAAAIPQREPDRLQATDTGKLIAREGAEVIVSGRVSGTSVSSSSGHHFLNLSGASLRVLCFGEDLAAFPVGGPAKLYMGKSVEIRGTVDLYKNNPQIRIRAPDQIREIGTGSKADSGTGAFALKQLGKDSWVSPAGLNYVGRDPQGKTRVDHILRHANDLPGRDGSHGVFDGGRETIFPLLDEAWQKARRTGIRPVVESDSLAYTIPMGRKIGYLGGRTGAARKNPPLTRVFIVMKRGTTNVVTAFPK